MDLEELKGEIQSVCWEIASKGQTLDARALTQLAEEHGWYEGPQKGSHHHFIHPGGGQYRFTLAYHGDNDTFDRSVVKGTIRDIFRPQIDQLLEQKTPGAVESTVDKLLVDLRTSLSFENLGTNLLEKVNYAYQEAMQRIETFEVQCIQDAELARQELLAEQTRLLDTAPIHIQELQSQLDQVISERTTLVQAKQSLEDELCGERELKKTTSQHLQKLEHQVLAKEAEIAALETKSAELQQALEQSYSDIEAQRTQVHTLEHQLREQIEFTKQTVEQSTSSLQQALEIAQAKQVRLQAEREQALNHTISRLQARLDQGEQKIAILHQQTQTARAEKHAAELVLQSLQQRLRELEQQDNASLPEQLSKLQSKSQTQEVKIKTLQQQLITLTATKQHLEATVQQLHTQFNQAQSERVQLQNRLSEFERLDDDRQAARAKASRDIERLEAELAESQSRLAAAVNQSSIQRWLRDIRTQMQAQGVVKRWLVQAAVAVAVFCVSWISQVM